MKWRIVASVLILMIVLSACNLPSNSSATSGGKSSAGDLQYIFDAPLNPVDLSVTLQNDQRVEADIPLEGGSLLVSAADGTTFTLEIPSDALTNPTKIAMQPVASISGLPFGGEQTYAVQLEPEGLVFNNFVTLTITPPQDLPVDQQILFSYKADGKDMTLATPVVDSREIKIKLLHFSGYGVTKGLLADIEPVRKRLGGDAEARLQSAIAADLAAERQRQMLGGEPGDISDTFTNFFKQFEEQVIKPRVAAAGESCAAGRLALQSVLSLERQKQLLGVSDGSFGDQIADLMKTVSTVCVKEEYDLCVNEHIIHRMIPVWLGISRQYQLLGIAPEGGPEPEEIQLAKDLTKKCLTFELEFNSTGTFSDSGGGGFESIVESKVKLHFDPDSLKINGQAPLVNKSFDFQVTGCSTSSNRGGGTFDASSLTYITDTHSPTDEVGYVRDFNLSYYPGNTSESFSVTCEDSPTFTSPPNIFWTGTFMVSHQDELDLSGVSDASQIPDFSSMFGAESGGMPGMGMSAMPGTAGFLAQDWEVFGNEYYAKKEWTKEVADLGVVEVGTFKLYHRPGQ
ncbi:MAG: hypothetical protein CVU46_16865 [Chloroflexi bacterium HGW-Chloroflexi-8]|nr:MAG: hypothetical protein CVU46_16865 [Chloroflexi bacterium HGW-Chloroflexi-8]